MPDGVIELDEATDSSDRHKTLGSQASFKSGCATTADDPATRLANRNGCSEGQVGGHGRGARRSSAPGCWSPGSFHPSNAHFGPARTRRLDAGPSLGSAGCHDRGRWSASLGDHIEDGRKGRVLAANDREFHGVMRKDRSAMHGLRGSRIGESFSRGRRDRSLWIARRRVGEVSNPGPSALSRLRRVGLGMRVPSVSRGRGEVEDPVSSNDDAHATEPAVSIPTWIDQSQTQETDPASILPTWVDMRRGDDEDEAREPHRRRIMPGQGRVDPIHMEDEVNDVVNASKRDLPVLSHTPTAMLTGRRLVLIPQTQGGTPRSVQDVSEESSDTEVHEPPGDMLLGVGWQSRPSASMWQVRSVGRR